MNQDELQRRQQELLDRYDSFLSAGLKLDLTRGKPAPEQLDLSDALDGILGGFYLLQDGTDVRNYGGMLGIPEARQLGAEILEVDPVNVLVGGNSSLTLMFHYVAHMVRVWRATEDTIKFLCPVPGYDRHFTVCEHFDIEMICVPMVESGPDMDVIEQHVRDDPTIKGIWCVPKYSNPTGHTYYEATVKRFAGLASIASPNFRIFWDNAYAVHHLDDEGAPLANLAALANAQGNADSVAAFGSTSKITFAGAGISFLATSESALNSFVKYLGSQTIGFDKVNQLRHARFLINAEGVAAHMQKHRSIIQPKFDLVQAKLDRHLGGKDLATWSVPKGGYFISLDTNPGLAAEVVRLAAEAGVKLTPAGATFPYGADPDDNNIRIAPTYPSIEELEQAMDVLVTCVELASVTQSLNQ